jgi:PAS domain S-box-containing protein
MQVNYQNRERQQKDRKHRRQEKVPCKKTKQELLESEAKFRSLVEATSDWIWQVDQKGFFTYVSPRIKDVLGYEPEDVLGKTPYTLMPKKEVTKLKKQFLKISKNTRPFFNLENWNLTKNGQLVLLETSGVPIYDVDGQMVGYRGINRDITERKKIEEALKESEQLYRTLFDNSDDGFLLVEPVFEEDGNCDFKILKLNKAYERQTGVNANVLLGKKARTVIPALEEKYFSIVCKVAKTAKPLHIEEFNKASNKWYDSYYFPYIENKVGVLFRDITDRKKAETALRSSEESYRAYVESSPVAFFVINSKQQYILVNDRACKLLGYSRQELLKMAIFDIVFKEDIALTSEQYAELQETGKSIREFRLKRKDGKPVYVILNVIMLSDGRAMAFCEDITERKKLEKRLQINERLAAIGATASMVGHDIRNPLQAMLSDIFLLKSELAATPIGDSVIENLTDLEDNILYINKIVADLQDYSRRLNPEFSIVELSEVICNVLSNITLPENVAFSVNVTGVPSIRTDPALIQRVLTNLVNNSIQAMPDGGNLTITGSIKEEKLHITVADTGVGIPEEIQAKLFQPMFTTKAKGQGLGLAVAKRLINALNGAIKFESKNGVGTKFTIELPLVP